jgi:hypothetical protein
MFGGWYYWFPKIAGFRLNNERTHHDQADSQSSRDERGQTEVLKRHRPAWAHKDGDGFSLKLD